MTILKIVILVAAGLFALLTLISLLRGVLLRASIAQSPYGVGRQERRKSMQIAFLRGVVFAVLALILFGVYGLSARPDDMLSDEPAAAMTTPLATSTSTLAPATATSTTAAATPTTATTATATTPAATATATLTPIPTITPTPPPTAVVTAPAGVYLRESPDANAEAIERLFEGTVVTLLGGEETIDEVLWRQVQLVDGREGWVAAELDGVQLLEPQ